MAYLQALLDVDFCIPCRPTTFCRICEEAVCQTCCPEHAASQHGIAGGAPHTIDVTLLEGRYPAVTVHSVRTRGLGYNWNRIQRVPHAGTNYVMLGREQPRWNRGYMRGSCRPCNVPVGVNNEHCCASCKVAAVQHGQSRGVIQRLVGCDFSRTHLLDRFCLTCLRAFSSDMCPDHTHHHPGAEQFRVLHIVRQDGWFLVPEDQLPPHLVAGVKRVPGDEDGTVMVPIRRRMLPNPTGGSQLCSHCQEEAVGADDVFCSLCCSAMQ